MGEEAVPVVLLAHRVERPVGGLGVDEDDPGVRVLLVVVGPDVVVAVRPVGVVAGLLEPRVLVAGVVHDEVDDHAHAALVRGVDELHEVREVAELRQHRGVVGDVVTAVPQRGLEERRQPEAVDAQPLQIVELGGDALEVADAVAVAVLEGADEDFVEDGAFEPVGIPVLGRGVLEGVRDGLVDDHDVGDPPVAVRTVAGRSGRARARGPVPGAHSCPAPVVGLAGELVAHRHGSCPSRPSCGMSNETVASWVWWGSRLTTTTTVSGPVALAVRDHRVVVGVVEVEVPEQAQGAVVAAGRGSGW